MADPRQVAVSAVAEPTRVERTGGLDETAFNDLYRRVARPLWGYLRRVTGDPAQADDVLQEAFTRLLVQASPPEDDAARRAWLFKVASHLVVDAARRRKHEAPASAAESDGPAEPMAAPGATRDPILARQMGRTFERLAAQERALLWLAYVEESSHREIAGALGVKESSIRVLLFRARKKLAALWTRRLEEPR